MDEDRHTPHTQIKIVVKKLTLDSSVLKSLLCQAWWHTSLISELGRQSPVDLSKVKASLIYMVSSRTAVATGGPCLKKIHTHTKDPVQKISVFNMWC